MTPTTRTALRQAAESMNRHHCFDALFDEYDWHASEWVFRPGQFLALLSEDARIWLILLILEAEK